MKGLNFSRELHYQGIVAGVDEAGRGPWAGPVVAGIVILDRSRPIRGVNDSKQVKREQREALFERIMERSVVGIGICNSVEVDRHNILGATKLAMQRAFAALAHQPDIALIDGNQLPDLPCAMDAIVDGDMLCISIAAASIIAKVTRDRLMRELALEHPHYGWERNVGYGTKEHQEGLKRHGICHHHRRSFAPIREIISRKAA